MDNIDRESIFNDAINFHLSGDFFMAEKLYNQLLNLNYRKDVIFSNLGVIYKVQNNFEKAKEFFERAIDINPRYADPWSNLGDLYRLKGLFDNSIVACSKAISISSSHENAYLNLGAAYKEKGLTDHALTSTLKALDINPNNSVAYINLSTLYVDKFLLDKALISIKKAISLKPSCHAFTAASIIYFELGTLDMARKFAMDGLHLNPDDSQLNYIMGKIERSFGHLEVALNYFENSIKFNMYNIESYFELSKGTQIKLNAELLLKKLCKLDNSNLSNKRTYLFEFAKSNFYHILKDYENSSICLCNGNNIKLKSKPSDKYRLVKKINYLSSLEYINNFRLSDGKGRIFIVGMPRSGSTLLETILSLRPNTLDLGEKPYLERAIEIFNSSHNSLNLSEIYQNQLDLEEQYEYTVDKQLYNFMYSGFIATHMPKAKIIHCCRNPLDNILSCYRACFGQQNSYTSSLKDTAEILIQQEIFMKKFKTIYSDQIYTFNYDLFVSDQKNYLSNLLDWLNWDWDERFLLPQLSTRIITSSSDVQSRNPIHSQSLGGWKKYSDLLSPAKRIINLSNLFDENYCLK
jgi:tetratricopeptide (TPR) repeat protein